MVSLTERIIEAGLGDRLFNEHQLARVLEGSAQSRYGIVNRALKAGELCRYQRGLYSLSDSVLHKANIHPFYLAQTLKPGSYISLETSLSYHGWIPEAVFVTASITPGRKSRKYQHEQLGQFSYHPLATQKGHFLELVERVEVNNQPVLIAKPIRALMDLIALKKLEWQGLEWLTQGMRIETEYLKDISHEDIETLKKVYKHKKVIDYLSHLSNSLELEDD